MTQNPTTINNTFYLDINGTFAAGDTNESILSYVDYPIEKLPQDVIKEVIDMDIVGVIRAETLQSLLDVAWEK